MTDIFISYSRRDIEVAQQLAKNLQELGYTVWWDMTGLHGGQTFASVIQQKLSEAQCAIVLWSPDSVVSNWVHSEASFADSRGILLTAMYRESQAPMPFNNRHNEDLRDWNGSVFDDGFQKLLKAISQYCPEPSGKPRQGELEARPDEDDVSVVTPTAVTQETSELGDKQSPQPSEQSNTQPITPNETIKTVVNTETAAATTKPTGTGTGTGTGNGGSDSSGLVKKVLAAAAAIGVAGFFLYPKEPTSEEAKNDPSQNTDPTPAVAMSPAPITPTAPEKTTPMDVPLVKATAPASSSDSAKSTEFIETLLSKANISLENRHLTTPDKDSVRFYTGSVLKADPDNLEAKNLLGEAVKQYHLWARANIPNKRFDEVEKYLKSSGDLINEFSLGNELAEKQTEISEALKVTQAAAAKAQAEKAAASKIYQLSNDLTLVPIPAGSFMMGSNEYSYEQPIHKVTFTKPFWMSKTEITFDQYDAYAAATGKEKPSDQGFGRGNRPAINVSWHDAQGYVKWLSQNNNQGLQCRLPSESEWEYAARAGTTTKYFWGDQVGKNNANCDGCDRRWGRDKTAPVASYTANAWGLHDMHGNVREWVQDTWHKDYTGAPNNGGAWDSGGGNRVVRGGSGALRLTVCVPRSAATALRTVETSMSGFVLFAPPIDHWTTELWPTDTPFPI